MRLKFSTKLVLLNIAVAAILTAVIGFIVVQGLMLNNFNDTVDNLVVIADESSVMIRQSILSLASVEDPESIYKQNGDFYATQISSVYGINVMLFDTGNKLIGTNTALEDYTAYSKYSAESLKAKKQAYVYTDIGGADYIIFCAPVFIKSASQPVGVLLLFYPAAAVTGTAISAVYLFIIAGLISAALAALLYIFSYRRMLRPINQLVAFTQTAGEGEKIEFPEINYFVNDEIGSLVDGFKELTIRINEKIDEINFEKEKMGSIFSSMQDGVLAVTPTGDIVTANERINDMFPPPNDVRGVIPSFYTLLNTLIKEKSESSSEFAYESKNYLLNARRIMIKEKQPGVLMVISDVTAIKKVEEEQNRFISSVSHELKTPLTTVIGYTDLMQRRGFADKELTEKALATIKNEGNRLLRLVNDLLNINKFHSYDFDLIFTDIDPDSLIGDVVSEMNIAAAPLDMAVVYDKAPLPGIKGDYDRLKQALINVIDNALKYSHSGDAVKISAIPLDEQLEITVRDYGEGIPEGKREKVFETFYRVEEDRSRLTVKGGFGLGLAIVKNIIERHNGSVSVESVQGSGTLVVIKLPLPVKAVKDAEVENEE